jgi:hypothetical protein
MTDSVAVYLSQIAPYSAHMYLEVVLFKFKSYWPIVLQYISRMYVYIPKIIL